MKYSYLEVSDLLPSSVSVLPGCPRELRLEKLTSSGYLCDYFSQPYHKNLTCPRLNSHCSTYILKGHSYLIRRMQLDYYLQPIETMEEIFQLHQIRLQKQLHNAERSMAR